MLFMKTTPKGTISARRHNMGISSGVYAHESVCSLEYSPDMDELILRINRPVAREDKIRIIYTDKNWNDVQSDDDWSLFSQD
jgi:hypothetical protein